MPAIKHIVAEKNILESFKELAKIDRRETKAIVPPQRQALHNPECNSFSKDKCIYDMEQDCYYCPEGNRLVCKDKQNGHKSIAYRIK